MMSIKVTHCGFPNIAMHDDALRFEEKVRGRYKG